MLSKLTLNKGRIMCTRLINNNELNYHLPFPSCCRNLVLAVPIDTSGETYSAQVGDAERASVCWVFLVIDKLNLWSYKPFPVPTMVLNSPLYHPNFVSSKFTFYKGYGT
jgi:hypothetical protein